MRVRPIEIKIVSLAYVFLPVIFILLNSVIFEVPLTGAISVFHFVQPMSVGFLLLFPFVGYVVYQVREWSWWFSLVFALLLVIYSVATLIIVGPSGFVWAFFIRNSIISLITLLVLRKNVKAPYFNPRLRWWEVSDRFKYQVRAEILSGTKITEAEIIDISTTGCYVVGKKIESDSFDRIRFAINDKHFEIEVKLIRYDANSSGLGLLFKYTKRKVQNDLKETIAWLKQSGLKPR